MCKRKGILSLLLLLCCFAVAFTQSAPVQKHVTVIPIAKGWAGNSGNAVIFRRNSLATHGNTHFAAYYDPAQYLVLANLLDGQGVRNAYWQACVDARGTIHLSWVWREQDAAVPQYDLVHHNGQAWQTQQVSTRTIPFSLRGGGTKRILISRPQVLLRQAGGQEQAFLIFRDAEREDKVSVAMCRDFPGAGWETADLTQTSVGSWEPSYDTVYWKKKGVLNLFLQRVAQVDGEGVADQQPEMVGVLEWRPGNNL